ncbi:Putative protease Do-like 14 [Linum perenne]
MNGLLQRKASSARYSLIRIAAVAAATAGGGTALLYANDDLNSGARISLSVPEQWRLSQYLISSNSAERWQFGNPPLFSSRFNLVPDVNNGRSRESVGDGHNEGCGCLGRDTIANAAARVAPAVVNLSVPQGFYGFPGGKSIGSGTIIDANGTILTCAHVVVDYRGMKASAKRKSFQVDVTLQDGRTFEGTVLNADLHSDIAIVKIDSKTPLPTAKLGSSSKIRPGEWVLAVGCPLSLQNTVTMGIISCVDRKSSDLGLGGVRREYLQTDCAINAGNSGGPWLGLRMIELNDMIIAQLKERDPRFPDVNNGIFVPMVTPGSPADKAGFRPGDVLVQFDDRPVGSVKEVIDLMDDRVGVPIKAVVKRPKDVTVTLTVIPEEANPDI